MSTACLYFEIHLKLGSIAEGRLVSHAQGPETLVPPNPIVREGQAPDFLPSRACHPGSGSRDLRLPSAETGRGCPEYSRVLGSFLSKSQGEAKASSATPLCSWISRCQELHERLLAKSIQVYSIGVHVCSFGRLDPCL